MRLYATKESNEAVTYLIQFRPNDPEDGLFGQRRIAVEIVTDGQGEVFLGTLFVPDELADEIYADLQARLV